MSALKNCYSISETGGAWYVWWHGEDGGLYMKAKVAAEEDAELLKELFTAARKYRGGIKGLVDAIKRVQFHHSVLKEEVPLGSAIDTEEAEMRAGVGK